MQLERIHAIQDIQQGPVYAPESENEKEVLRREVVHPYVGYVTDGKVKKDGCESAIQKDCLERIKSAIDRPFVKRSKERLIVGVLGGSVAVGTLNATRPYKLYEKLFAELPEYKGREIIVYGLAAGGYRQPQQVMLLNYYYSLGAEFDILISLDGFNDVAIPVTEYKINKMHPSFPRSWVHRVAKTVSKDLVDLSAKKMILQSSHSSSATIMSNPWFRNSPLSNLLWKIKRVRYLNGSSSIDQDIDKLTNDVNQNRDFRYEGLGPDYEFTTWDDLFQYSVNMWATSSHLVHAVAVANGAKYFHFLQPNQYIDGGKPVMNERERRIAFMTNGGYGNLYKRIYPRILKKVTWLKERGIDFYDLSYLYKDIKSPIYIDNCCHVNARGSNMMVEKIVDTIHQSNVGQENK